MCLNACPVSHKYQVLQAVHIQDGLDIDCQFVCMFLLQSFVISLHSLVEPTG